MLVPKKKYLVILLVFNLFAVGCSKDAGLTKATQDGAQTLSCKVNGKIYTPKVSLFGGSPLYCQYRFDSITKTNKLIIGSTMPSDPVQHVSMTILGCDKPGIYSLSGEVLYNVEAEYDLNAGGLNAYAKVYVNNIGSTGEVEITKLDRVRKIVSGTFWFKLTNRDNPSNMVNIDRGRFDLKYE